MEVRVEISRRLAQSVQNICTGSGTVDLFEDLMEDFIDASDFMDYFKAVWYPRIGQWTTTLKTLPLSSEETCAAMEFYHNQLKLRLLNEKDPGFYQRADWLVDKLGTTVHSFFWLDEYAGKENFARYWKDEWASGLTAWRKSLEIPDSAVVVEGKCAKVIDQQDQDRVYVVWSPGSEFAICNCSWAGMGNLCEHVFKVRNVFRDKGSTMPSISMFQYNQALINMLNCPPGDSLIRDHAVSLAVWVQMQLQAQIHAVGDHTTDSATLEPVSTSQGEDPVNEDHFRDETSLSYTVNGNRVGYDLGHTADDVGEDLIDQGACENENCGERTGKEISCAEMEVDPSSTCPSASEIFCDNDILSNDALTEKGDIVIIDKVPNTSANDVEDDLLDNDYRVKIMDMELQSIDIPLSTAESLVRCTVVHQNGVCSNDAELSVISHIANDNPKNDNTSLSISSR